MQGFVGPHLAAYDPSDLATALRHGLGASLLQGSDSSSAEPEEIGLLEAAIRSQLQPTSGLLGLSVAAPSGWGHLLAAPLRKLLRWLLAPWLDQQTKFNHTVIDLLEQMHRDWSKSIQQLSLKQQQLRQEVQEFALSLHPQSGRLAVRQPRWENDRLDDGEVAA